LFIKVVLREIRIQDFQGDCLPLEKLLDDFPASDYAVDDATSGIALIERHVSADELTARLKACPDTNPLTARLKAAPLQNKV